VGPTAIINALAAVEFQCENRLEPALIRPGSYACDFDSRLGGESRWAASFA